MLWECTFLAQISVIQIAFPFEVSDKVMYKEAFQIGYRMKWDSVKVCACVYMCMGSWTNWLYLNRCYLSLLYMPLLTLINLLFTKFNLDECPNQSDDPDHWWRGRQCQHSISVTHTQTQSVLFSTVEWHTTLLIQEMHYYDQWLNNDIQFLKNECIYPHGAIT